MKFEVSGPAHESEIIHNKKSKQRCQELGLTRLETTTQAVGAGKETDRQTDWQPLHTAKEKSKGHGHDAL